MNNVIVSTGYKLAQSVVANGQITGNPWQNPQNVFLSDGLFATSNSAESAASDFVVGNFALGIPTDAVITGFLVKILGKQGAQTVPPLTLTMSAVDNTNGPDVFHPYTAPYTGLTPNNEEHFLGGANYLFDTAWTATQANNIKLAFQANGDISLDSVSVNVLYYVPGAAPSPDPLPAGCEDCNSVIQVQKMTLKVAFKVTDTEFIIAPGAFAYADGTPVQPGDLGSCGGEIDFVFDQGLRKPIDGNFAENVVFFSDTGSWVVLGDGSTKFTLGSFTDRGRQFHEPYGHDANLVSGHAANSEVVISNNGRFYSRFVRRCQEDIVFSPPIAVQDEGSDVVSALHTLNFRGPNVQAEQDSGDIHQANVDILANPTNVSPTVEDSNEGTTGTTPATSISIPLTIVAANYLRIWISSQDEATPTVTFDGVPATIIGSETHGSADLKAFLFDLVSPNAGAHNVVITFANAINFSAGAVSFLDVDISNPVDGISAGTSGNGTAPTDTLTTTIQNTLAQDVVAVMSNPTAFTQGALWTIQGQVNAASYPGASSTRKVLIPGTVTDTYSILPTGDWVLLLAGVRGNTAASSSDEKVKVTSSDTTPGYLGAKLNIHSSDASVTVVKTTTNPGGNEISDYDLTVIGGGTGTALETTVSQTGHGLSVGDVIKVSGTNTFAKAQGDSEVNSEAVGVVTTVVNANSFKYVSSAIQLAYAPVGTPGSAVWLDPTAAGGMTATKPSTVGQVARALGTIIESGVTMYFDIAALAEVIGSGSGTGVGSFAKRIYAYIPGSASGAYTFAHGLGVTPTYGLTQVYSGDGITQVGSVGQTDFSALQSCVYTVFTISYITAVSTAQSFFYQTGTSVSSYGTLSADATNVTATVAGSSSAGDYYIIIDLYI